MIFVGTGTMGQITLGDDTVTDILEPAQRGRVLSILLLGAGLGGLMTFRQRFSWRRLSDPMDYRRHGR